MKAEAYKNITHTFKNKKQFFKHFFLDQDRGGLFLKGVKTLDEGDPLWLDLIFETEAKTFRISGKVAWKREKGSVKAPAGIGFEFSSAGDDSNKALLDFVGGHEIKYHRRKNQRVPAKIEIKYWHQSAFVTHYSMDISKGGTFLKSDDLLPLGTEVPLQLRIPGQQKPLDLTGVVVWHRTFEPNKGMGLQFLITNNQEQLQMEELVSHLSQSLQQELGSP